jgi:hypothetical protein
MGCSSGGAKDAATDAAVMPCNGVSAAEGCPSGSSCDATWSAVLSDQTLCPFVSPGMSYTVYDCGGYHVLDEFGSDRGTTYYYDMTSGDVVAIFGGSNWSRCLAGPSTGFDPPSECQLDGPPGPPPQCPVDAGLEDGSRD